MDLGDLARLKEAHPALEAGLPADGSKGNQALIRERSKGARSQAAYLQLVSER